MPTPILTAAGEAAFVELIHLIFIIGGIIFGTYFIIELLWGEHD